MTDKTMDEYLLTYFHSLPKHDKMSVLDYLKSLTKKAQPSNAKLLSLVGTIPTSDLDQMEAAIKEGCENIDKDEW